MRWLTVPKRDIEYGTKRDVLRFAFLPTLVDEDDVNATTVWLERYRVYQEFGSKGYGVGWITVAKYSIS